MAAPGEAGKLPVDIDAVDVPFAQERQTVVGERFPAFLRAGHYGKAARLEVVRIGDGMREGEADLEFRMLLLDVDDLLEAFLVTLQLERNILSITHIEFRKCVVDMGQHFCIRRLGPVVSAVSQDDAALFPLGMRYLFVSGDAAPIRPRLIRVFNAGEGTGSDQEDSQAGKDSVQILFHGR